MHVVLLNKRNDYLESGGDTFGEEIEVAITFPSTFKDIGMDGKVYEFQTEYDYQCRSLYSTISGLSQLHLFILVLFTT